MSYNNPDSALWKGRESESKAYLHEVIECRQLNEIVISEKKKCVLLGYVCEEGVKRNLGRTGAKHGPGEIRNWLAKLSNHLGLFSEIIDAGDIVCEDKDLEKAQQELAEAVCNLLKANCFPILMGGGHDIAYGHYKGIRMFAPQDKIGIVNFDAHFDLRKFEGQSTSGTPFFQIAADCATNGNDFRYLCLGVQPLSNIAELYDTANSLRVEYIERNEFSLTNLQPIHKKVSEFIASVDYLYVTIDMDGFAASIAPGVSAPSPFGYEVELVLKVLDILMDSGKIISIDVAELNPVFDIDGHTARLAAYLIAYCIQHN